MHSAVLAYNASDICWLRQYVKVSQKGADTKFSLGDRMDTEKSYCNVLISGGTSPAENAQQYTDGVAINSFGQ